MLGLRPISGAALSSLPIVFAGGVIGADVTVDDTLSLTVYAASTEFISLASDAVPNKSFLGTLQTPIRFNRSIVAGDGYGELSVGYGEMELTNIEADYDDLFQSRSIDGQPITMKVGARASGRVGAYDDFVTVGKFTATRWLAGEDVLRIEVRDNSYKLEVPTQPGSYAGTGNLEGPVDLAGKRKPIMVGEPFEPSPVLVIPAELVYQINDGPIEAITAVYDSGFALAATSDYATSILLRAATLVPGQYATCLAEGLIRLGGPAQGKVTIAGQGENADGYIETTADIVRFLVVNAADVIDPDDFDDLTFDTLNTLQPATIGYYIDENSNETLAETIANLMRGIGGWAGFTRLGLFEVRRFDAPGITSVEQYDQYDYLSAPSRERLPAGIDPIVRRVRIGYAYNWTVQAASELAALVAETDPVRAATLSKPYSIAATSDTEAAAILSRHPLAHDPDPVVGYFADEADAAAEASRRLELYGVLRSSYRFEVQGRLFSQDIGDCVFVSEPRLDLTDGKNMRVVDITEDVESNKTQIVVFG